MMLYPFYVKHQVVELKCASAPSAPCPAARALSAAGRTAPAFLLTTFHTPASLPLSIEKHVTKTFMPDPNCWGGGARAWPTALAFAPTRMNSGELLVGLDAQVAPPPPPSLPY